MAMVLSKTGYSSIRALRSAMRRCGVGAPSHFSAGEEYSLAREIIIRFITRGFPDFMSIFGNNNDRVAFFVFPSVASMSALNSTLIAGQDADVVFTNYGFSAANIPSAQDPFIP